MPKLIVWSELADNDFACILEYLEQQWGTNVVSRFMENTFERIENISFRPKQYPLISKRNRVRKCVLTKRNSPYYKESQEAVEILRIFDTRLDIKKLRLR